MTGVEFCETDHSGAGLSLSSFDARHFRGALGRFATGVTVVSYKSGKEIRGATVNSFTSVSIDPPLVLVSIGRNARAAQGLLDTPFTVNVLSARQHQVAMHFAGKPQFESQISWVTTAGPPRLRGVAAWFQCVPWQTVDAGDHILFLGQVTAYDHSTSTPLVFHEGQFRSIG
jgi:flavin reductase (DIM6/NTAB) family NADH-FMN oxidoreductase RutF